MTQISHLILSSLCKALPTTLPTTTIAPSPPPTPTTSTSPPISVPALENFDLELCTIWPWQEPSRRAMILQRIAIVKCGPYEKCTSVPKTEIYGLNFGYELPLFLKVSLIFGIFKIKSYC